jgi:hypothetical protein
MDCFGPPKNLPKCRFFNADIFRYFFRWDGTPLVDQSKDSKLLKKVKSLDEQPRRPAAKQRSIDERAPRPPKRDSSITRQKREEIK